MTTLYLKIDERDGIVSPNFRAYSDGNGKGIEAYIALEIVTAIRDTMCENVVDHCVPESFSTEARKLYEELCDLCSVPTNSTKWKRSIAKRLWKEIEQMAAKK